MRWEDEPYIKWYTRMTPEFLALSVQARGLLPLICSVVDRAGTLSVGKLGLKGVAVALHCSWPEVASAMHELVEDGRIVFDDQRGVVLVPNHIEAQGAKQSDAARKRKSREEARAFFGASLRASETARQATSVTHCDGIESHNVTVGHERSHGVTSGHSSLEEKRSEELRREGERARERPDDNVSRQTSPPTLAARDGTTLRAPPDDIEVTKVMADRCRLAGAKVPEREHVVAFLAHARDKGRTSADWEAALVNWMVRQKGYDAARGPTKPRTKQPSAEEWSDDYPQNPKEASK